jgi:meso-butanediol dehydrogenase/(S,S)-butanediol dehydrogenase/diacetyl reductase
MQRFSNKVALVTGAASGIGRATAVRLAQEGAQLMLADINESGLNETLASIRDAGGDVISMPLDVMSFEACQNVVAETVKHFGKLDVLCNIAGIALSKHVEDISQEEWARMVGINLNSVFFLSQAAIPHLLKSKGNIVNMASTAALVGQIYNSAYCATKGAVMMLTKSMAVEFAKQGVRVNCICPGAVKTALTENFSIPEDADIDLVMRMTPLLEPFAEAEEIAGAVAYLACDEARFITGEALTIDGGQTVN